MIVNIGFKPNGIPGAEALGLGLNVNIEMPSLKLGAIEVLLTLVPSKYKLKGFQIEGSNKIIIKRPLTTSMLLHAFFESTSFHPIPDVEDHCLQVWLVLYKSKGNDYSILLHAIL
jgi:hypothetical protein